MCERERQLSCNKVCCLDGNGRGVKELVVVVGEKLKDESMKMNREDDDDLMGWLDATLFLDCFALSFTGMK